MDLLRKVLEKKRHINKRRSTGRIRKEIIDRPTRNKKGEEGREKISQKLSKRIKDKNERIGE